VAAATFSLFLSFILYTLGEAPQYISQLDEFSLARIPQINYAALRA
jgi:hypothetical protein